jgi:hypothetical protein
MGKTKPGSRNVIVGIVIANGWDKDGNVTNVAIYSDNEEIYHIDQSEYLKDLLDKLQKRVRVTGEIVERANNQKRIAVDSLKVLMG